jgi:phage-related protein
MLLRLAEHGHELRRPHCDYLGDGVFELRARLGRVNYRILYFFFGQNVVGLAAGLTKEEEVPDQDIQRAVQRRRRLEGDPAPYVCEVEL